MCALGSAMAFGVGLSLGDLERVRYALVDVVMASTAPVLVPFEFGPLIEVPQLRLPTA
jgi:hypothetical protein